MQNTTQSELVQAEDSYKDSQAKSLDLLPGHVVGCGSSVLWGHAEDQGYGKRLYCQREWCPTCGTNRSDAHSRRYARLIPRVQQFSSMGYWVIQFPISVRHRVRDRNIWRKIARAVVGVLKEWYPRGLRRWHWFGTPRCPQCSGRLKEGDMTAYSWSCSKCGHAFHARQAVVEWNPHLNVLVDGGRLSRSELERRKRAIAAALRSVVHFEDGDYDAIIHYSYTHEPGRMLHAARYITRATFRHPLWDVEMYEEIDGFRNTWFWGSFKESAKWELREMDDTERILDLMLLEHGICPITKARIKWTNTVISEAKLRQMYDFEELGGGYIRLIPKRRKKPGEPFGNPYCW